MRGGYNSSTHSLRHNTSLRGSALERRASYNPLFSKGLGVPHIIPTPFPSGQIHPVPQPPILCSARILRSFWTESKIAIGTRTGIRYISLWFAHSGIVASSSCMNVETRARCELTKRSGLTSLWRISTMPKAFLPLPAGYGLHPLKGDLKGFWSISIFGNWRII